MKIRDIMYYSTGLTSIIVFDCANGIEDDIFVGYYDDIPYELENEEVVGWELETRDNELYICFNIDTSEEEG